MEICKSSSDNKERSGIFWSIVFIVEVSYGIVLGFLLLAALFCFQWHSLCLLWAVPTPRPWSFFTQFFTTRHFTTCQTSWPLWQMGIISACPRSPEMIANTISCCDILWADVPDKCGALSGGLGANRWPDNSAGVVGLVLNFLHTCTT